MDRPIHTTDLTTPCLRRVKLTLDGAVPPEDTEAQGALTRGLCAHHCLAIVHTEDAWDLEADAAQTIAELGWASMERQLKGEGRPLSRAVANGQDAIVAQVAEHVRYYSERFAPVWRDSELLGVEVPVRMEVSVDDEWVMFNSHIDCIRRHENGVLYVLDWKWTGKAPTRHFLSRSLQLAMYYVATARGQVAIGGEWTELAEWPEVRWVHLPDLKPYSRKGSVENKHTGEVREWKKGDPRPMENVFREAPFIPEAEARILDDFAERIRMMRLDLWPATPDPEGCMLCPAQRVCPAYDWIPGGEA